MAGATTNATALQAAIDHLYDLGGGVVDLPVGTITSNPIVLKTGVILRGQGINGTELKLADDRNADFIKSLNFDILTGRNKWLTSDGVQHGLGLMDLRINGNKANQTAGAGVKIYGKRLIVDRVLIYDCHDAGWYSECANVAGQTDWTDMPEGRIGWLSIRNCGGHGFHYRGPHDGNIGQVIVALCGGDGVRIESASGLYGAGCEIELIHSYANSGVGVNIITSQVRVKSLISESNFREGLIFDAKSAKSQVWMAQTYTNCRASGAYQAVIAGSYNSFSDFQISDNSVNKGGLSITGNKNAVGHLLAIGRGSSGTALSMGPGNYNRVTGHIEGWSGVGGTGLATGNGGLPSYLDLDLSIVDCATLWNNVTAGRFGSYNLRLYANAGQRLLAGDTTNPHGESLNVTGRDGTGKPFSFVR